MAEALGIVPWFFWLVIGSVLGWIVLVLAFLAVMNAKAVVERGEELTPFFAGPVYVGFVVGLVLDVIWNWTAGCWIYRERPRKITFTSRCKLHKKKPLSDPRGRKARVWCREMNKYNAGHC